MNVSSLSPISSGSQDEFSFLGDLVVPMQQGGGAFLPVDSDEFILVGMGDDYSEGSRETLPVWVDSLDLPPISDNFQGQFALPDGIVARLIADVSPPENSSVLLPPTIHLAVHSKDLQTVKIVLNEKFSSLHERDDLGRNPLHVALDLECYGIALYFVDLCKANGDLSPFFAIDGRGRTPWGIAVELGFALPETSSPTS